jgi:hypothetical protein
MAEIVGGDVTGQPVTGELSDDGLFAARGHRERHSPGNTPRNRCKNVAKASLICYIDILN